MEYGFPAGSNNGQITSAIEHISGQQINYRYDPLKRLTPAATVGPQWGQAYDPATNHIIGNAAISYDANGNTYSVYQGRTYDVENRLNAGDSKKRGTDGR